MSAKAARACGDAPGRSLVFHSPSSRMDAPNQTLLRAMYAAEMVAVRLAVYTSPSTVSSSGWLLGVRAAASSHLVSARA